MERGPGRFPLEDMPAEAVRIVDHARARGVTLRLMGGLAVRMQCTSLSFSERPYSDIDLMGLGRQSRGIVSTFSELGYEEDRAFDALHGAQRLRFEDHRNNRHVEVFLDKFRMDHTLDLADRLDIDPYTLSLTDLFITKVQVVKLDLKDLHDMFSLFRDHKISIDDREGAIDARRIAKLCAHDWGLYHTVLDNISKILSFYDDFKLDKGEKDSMDRRLWVLRLEIIEMPKGPFWKARDRLGERLPYSEEVEHIGGDE